MINSRTKLRRYGAVTHAVLVVSIVVVACQGDFAEPQLDNPNDPANGMLPPTPVLSRVDSLACGTNGARMQIEWTIADESGISEYQVFRTPFADTDPGDLILHVPAGSLSVIDDSGLTAGQVYYYRVRAVDGDGRIGLRSTRGSSTAASCP